MLSEDLRIKFFSKYSLIKMSDYRRMFFRVAGSLMSVWRSR